jgi:AraC-like DNA-binding protein
MTRQLVPDEVAALARSHTGIISQRSVVWDRFACDLIVKGPSGGHEVLVSPTVDTFFLTRSNDPHAIVKRLNKGPGRALTHPGAIVNFVAAGDQLVTQVRHGNSGMDRLALSILPRPSKGLGESFDIAATSLRSELMIERPLPREILKALAEEVTAPGLHGRLYAETLALALIIDLARHQGAQPRSQPIVKGGLAPWQLRRVEAMINDRITEDVSLSDLAATVSLSKSHFVRAFRKSTGLPPHKYLLSVRIERTKQLVRKGDMTLTEIGLHCGFKEQSQFIRAFRRLTGVSPGVWQRIQKL